MTTTAHDIPTDHADVAIVGGGPAGLTAAAALRRAGAGSVVVLEREHATGGIPRHVHHPGFGLRDLHRVMTGPAYAARLTRRATEAGVELRTGTQVTGWSADGQLETTATSGRRRLRARAVILATGCRERPRSARFVAGSRPQGVMTTGMLQQLVYLQGEAPGRRAVVVGAEHVSFSSLLTLHHGGAGAAAIVTDQPTHQTFAAFRAGTTLRFHTPVLTRTAVTVIHGRRRVEAVTLTDLDTGAQRDLDCDLVVFTADWIPDHEIAVLGGITLDDGTRGPRVDPGQHTTRPGVFAAGNLLHGAETAGVAALSGEHITRSVLAHLDGQPWPRTPIAIECTEPLHWIAPNSLTASGTQAPARGRFLLRAHDELIGPRIELTQDGRRLWCGRLPRVMPGRSAALPTTWTTAVEPAAGPVTIRVVRARRRPRHHLIPPSGLASAWGPAG